MVVPKLVRRPVHSPKMKGAQIEDCRKRGVLNPLGFAFLNDGHHVQSVPGVFDPIPIHLVPRISGLGCANRAFFLEDAGIGSGPPKGTE